MGTAGSQTARRIERRIVTQDFPAFTLFLDKHTIQKGAILEDFRAGPGHEGLRPHDASVASFHCHGRIYFNLFEEVCRNTEVLKSE
jgi:hypothetical protein